MGTRVLDPECLAKIQAADIKGKVSFYKSRYRDQPDGSHRIEDISLLLEKAGIEKLDISVDDQGVKKDAVQREERRSGDAVRRQHRNKADQQDGRPNQVLQLGQRYLSFGKTTHTILQNT